MQLHALFKTNQLSIKLTNSNGFAPGGNGGDDGVELVVEAGEDVQHELLIFQLLARRCHLLSEALHFGEVVGD